MADPFPPSISQVVLDRQRQKDRVDFAPAMLRVARQKAAGMPNIRLVEANAANLAELADQSFDLVLNMARGYFGALKAFLPQEIRQLFEQMGWRVLRCGGLGSLANLCGQETIERVLQDRALLEEFLTLCDLYDTEILVDGPGRRQRAGLIAVAERVG